MTNKQNNKAIRGFEGTGLHLVPYCLGLLCALFMCFVVGLLFRSVHRLEKLVSELSQGRHNQALMQDGIRPTGELATFSEKGCAYPFVYNKPHKTGSTKIRADITAWAKTQERRIFRCSSFIAQATFQMRECISKDASGCAIVATHIVMSPVMREILEAKIGKYKLVTSTRDPKKRILSSFLQLKQAKARHVKNSTDLNRYLQHYNPWSLYNYHTGENRVGRCPMKEEEVILLHDMINRADVVIDVDLLNVSRAILKHEKLFPLTDSVANVRYSRKLQLEPKTKELLRKASCVEEKIHKLYRIRMASAYEKATGNKCLSNSREAAVCFDSMYKESVK